MKAPASHYTIGNSTDMTVAPHERQARAASRLSSQFQKNAVASLCMVLCDVTAYCLAAILGVCAESLLQTLIHSTVATPTLPNALAGNTLAGLPVAIGVMLYFAYQEHYIGRIPFWMECAQIVTASTCAFLLAGFIAFSFHLPGTRTELLAPWLLFPFLCPALRQGIRHLLHHLRCWQLPVLAIGTSRAIEEANETLQSESLPGQSIVATLTPAQAVQLLAETSAHTLLDDHKASSFLLSLDETTTASHALIAQLMQAGVSFSLVPQLADAPIHNATRLSYFSHDTAILSFRNTLNRPLPRLLKIGFDFTISGLLLLAALPVFALLFLCVRMDGGPATYGHERLGLHGRKFRCLKFRSMVMNSDAVLAELLANDATARAEWESTRKLTNDPRITKIGHFLRKTSLDELPQLLNVLRLDMSLVGPRPIVSAEEKFYGADISYYRAIRPGVTGLWQVSGRSNTSYERRVQLDSWYVRNWTLWHDVAILLKTIPAVLFRSGAR